MRGAWTLLPTQSQLARIAVTNSRVWTVRFHPAILTVAEGVIAAASELALSVPLVVRLEGTNVEQGKEIMAASGLAIIPADNLEDAAEKIVAAVREAV